MRGASILIWSVVLAACTTVVPTPVYQPGTTQELTGAIVVEPFTYSPREDVAQDEIYYTMAGTWKLQQPVGAYVTQAVRHELRQAGISLAEGKCRIGGDVKSIRLEIGSAAYAAEIAYSVSSPGGRFERLVASRVGNIRLYDTGDAAAFLNQTISQNIDELLRDESFRATLRDECAA
ncbi:hypothetical protein [Dongia sp.]|uniref:hypothetical protein n=1 Tax=Dongia sp. TaxID=1977262 RepID=UPI0035B2AE7D